MPAALSLPAQPRAGRRAACKAIISYLSRYMTLVPGDIIATGTPSGVGMGKKPEPVWLKPGDVVGLGIEGLGQQRQTIAAYR
jgi:2-keto-4-pentenoate hydratase/2-oxohepta-3-ene-1,7-dioic acid hydratase in catechol pathway